MPINNLNEPKVKTEDLTDQKLKIINDAREVLRGDRNLRSDQLEKLYNELKHDNQFAYATEVLLVKMKMDEENCTTLKLKDYQKLALYIYKDHSLPSIFKFKKALQQLQNHEELATTLNCESLGLAGAIYKRKWQFDHQFKNLILSRYYYQRGYLSWKMYLQKTGEEAEKDIQNDDGYTAINYAYINELMAVDKLEEHGEITGSSESINGRFKEAAEVREFILKQFLDDINAREPEIKLKGYPNWVLATIAEAFFGLRKYEKARRFIKLYINASANEPWEIKSFNQQLMSIAYLQVSRKSFYANHPIPAPATQTANQNKEVIEGEKEQQDLIEESPVQVIIETDTKEIYTCLNLFVKDNTATSANDNDMLSVDEIKKTGKLGLALSGGGFRASFFQIGVLAALAEKDELRNIEVLSCVSGGSIIGAYYYIKLKKLLQQKADDEIETKDYIEIVKEIETEFLKGVQKNLRVRIFTNPFTTLKMLFNKNYSRTNRLGELYEKHLYRDIWKQVPFDESEIPGMDKVSMQEKKRRKKGEKIYMRDLLIKPKGEAENFDIGIDNWKRKNKIPQLILNATSVNTGHNWQFTASWMGEPPGNIQADIDVKPRLRRMYYKEAPGKYKDFKIGYAVGASSCVPVMFRPMPMYGLYPEVELQLIDGGLHDNQGIAALIEQECNSMIVSDGSGQLPTNTVSTNNEAAVFYRADNILQERLRELQFMDLAERNYTAQLNQLITVHLKNDLSKNPVKWKFCIDPTRTVLYADKAEDVNAITKYGVLKSVQSLLSEIRTDLDSFSDIEAWGLMYSGYLQTHYEHNKKNNLAAKEREEQQWKFTAIKEYLTMPVKAVQIEKVLSVGSKQFFKILKLSNVVKILSLLLLAGILFFVGQFVYYNWDEPITKMKIGGLVIILAFFLVTQFSKSLGTLLNIKGELKKWIILLTLAVFGILACGFYLIFLNWTYNSIGKIRRR